MEARVCSYCKTTFLPNKYSPRQKVCQNPECQKKRQMESMKRWRQTHPDYFKYDESKGAQWVQTQRMRSKLWREKNPDKVRAYRQKHMEAYRIYMREYMRRLRLKKKTEAPPAPDASPQPPA